MVEDRVIKGVLTPNFDLKMPFGHRRVSLFHWVLTKNPAF